jgi:hypothetical protein
MTKGAFLHKLLYTGNEGLGIAPKKWLEKDKNHHTWCKLDLTFGKALSLSSSRYWSFMKLSVICGETVLCFDAVQNSMLSTMIFHHELAGVQCGCSHMKEYSITCWWRLISGLFHPSQAAFPHWLQNMKKHKHSFR